MKMLIQIITLGWLLCLASVTWSLPITEADAFIADDKKAFREQGSSLIWLDVDTFENDDHLADMKALGWRLPTQAEVLNLLGNIFSLLWDLDTTVHYNATEFHVSGSIPFPEMLAMFGIFKTVAPEFDSAGQTHNLALGSFLGEDGNVKQAEIILFTNYYPPFYYAPGDITYGDFHETELYGWIRDESILSAPFAPSLLVREVSVPESSTVILLLLGLAGLGLKRRGLLNRRHTF